MIANKNKLGKNLMTMRMFFPEQYDFFPLTYSLPTDWTTFKQEFIIQQDSEPEKKKTT